VFEGSLNGPLTKKTHTTESQLYIYILSFFLLKKHIIISPK